MADRQTQLGQPCLGMRCWDRNSLHPSCWLVGWAGIGSAGRSVGTWVTWPSGRLHLWLVGQDPGTLPQDRPSARPQHPGPPLALSPCACCCVCTCADSGKVQAPVRTQNLHSRPVFGLVAFTAPPALDAAEALAAAAAAAAASTAPGCDLPTPLPVVQLVSVSQDRSLALAQLDLKLPEASAAAAAAEFALERAVRLSHCVPPAPLGAAPPADITIGGGAAAAATGDSSGSWRRHEPPLLPPPAPASAADASGLWRQLRAPQPPLPASDEGGGLGGAAARWCVSVKGASCRWRLLGLGGYAHSLACVGECHDWQGRGSPPVRDQIVDTVAADALRMRPACKGVELQRQHLAPCVHAWGARAGARAGRAMRLLLLQS